MFLFKPNYEKTQKRMDALWDLAIIDRPVVQFWLQKSIEDQVSLPPSH